MTEYGHVNTVLVNIRHPGLRVKYLRKTPPGSRDSRYGTCFAICVSRLMIHPYSEPTCERHALYIWKLWRHDQYPLVVIGRGGSRTGLLVSAQLLYTGIRTFRTSHDSVRATITDQQLYICGLKRNHGCVITGDTRTWVQKLSGLPPTAAELRLSQEFSDVSISISGSTFGCVSSAKSVYSHISKGLANDKAPIVSGQAMQFPFPSHSHPFMEVVSALRVHAVSGGNWRWVLPVWILGIVPVGTNTTSIGCTGLYTLVDIYRSVLVDAITPVVVVITTRASVVVSDILVVAATWYYIGRTSSVRTQLVRDVWVGRPNLTTVMFRDEKKYFSLDDGIYVMYSIVSLLNVFDLIMTTISISSSYIYVLDVTNLTTAMSIILISHFLICIREAAERSIQAFSSQSLSFVNSQGNPVPRRWLSSIEFAADIADPSAENSNAYAFSDLEDGLDSLRGEDNAVEESNDGIELEELAASVHSIDARIP
ncbi:predicted protein [Postia placenta Mad-698-R]|nr:predicted protein [Postia placenta Mad-698-R]